MNNFENPNQFRDQPELRRSELDMDFYQEMLQGTRIG